MLSDNFKLDSVLVQFESILSIEYTKDKAQSFAEILAHSKSELESRYQCVLDKPVYTIQAENPLVAGNLAHLEQGLVNCMQQISTLVVLSMFTKNPHFKLADVSYLGFTSETLTLALKYFTDKIQYEKRSTLIPSLIDGVNRLEVGTVKRLFVIMLVLEDLGISEAVAACAQLLYEGSRAL